VTRLSSPSTDDSAVTNSAASVWNLLLAASVAHPGENDISRIRGLVEPSVDWAAVLHLAEHHGTSSIVYRNLSRLSNVIPPDPLRELCQRYEQNVHKSLLLATELIRILDCVEALRIELIPYKGAMLSENYYGDMAIRQSGDIDLFVRAGDVAQAKDAVRELGYAPRVNIPKWAEGDYLATGYECTFDSPAGKNLLELQWALQSRFYAVDFEMEGLFARAVEGTVAGRAVKTLAPEDLLLVLCAHAAKHAWGRLIWLCDIAQIVKRENLNWDLVRGRVRTYGIERILHISLLLAKRFCRMEIPAAFEAALDDETAALVDEVAGNMACGVSFEQEQVSYFWFMMRLRERRMDRVRFLTRLAFTPGPGEWEAVRLPRFLFPLYRVVRLARLAGRLGRGIYRLAKPPAVSPPSMV
jgi:hypothetical protein